MQRKRLLTVWLSGCLAQSFICAVQANPVRDSKRVVNERTVDLTPLFHWWTNHTGARPLHAWAHLTGTVVATNALGWEIEGHSDTSRHTTGAASQSQTHASENRLLLRNPPAAEKGDFEKLSAQLKELNRQRSQLATQQTNAKNQANTLAHSAPRTRLRNAELRQANAVQSEAGRELRSVDAAIAALKKKLAAYPNTDHYVLDGFGLDTGEQVRGLPVYDYGLVLPK